MDEAFRFKYKGGRQRDGEVSRATLNRLRSSAEGSGEPGRGAMQRNDIIRAPSRKINCLEWEEMTGGRDVWRKAAGVRIKRRGPN